MRVSEHLRDTPPVIRIDTVNHALDDTPVAYVEIRAADADPIFSLSTSNADHFDAIAAGYTAAAERLRDLQHQQSKAAVA